MISNVKGRAYSSLDSTKEISPLNAAAPVPIEVVKIKEFIHIQPFNVEGSL